MILVRSTNLITQLVSLEHLVARFLEIHTPSHRSLLPERPRHPSCLPPYVSSAPTASTAPAFRDIMTNAAVGAWPPDAPCMMHQLSSCAYNRGAAVMMEWSKERRLRVHCETQLVDEDRAWWSPTCSSCSFAVALPVISRLIQETISSGLGMVGCITCGEATRPL